MQMKTPSEQDLKSLSFNLTNLEYQLQATLSAVRAILGKQDEPQPSNATQVPAFDMETQVKASGQWECNDLRCRNCSNDQKYGWNASMIFDSTFMIGRSSP
jgi:hypothetical protein